MVINPSLDRPTLPPPQNAAAIPEQVTVTLLLEGGHQYTLPLATDAPLLRRLFELVVDPSADRRQHLLQIPVEQGKAVLCFPGDRLIGLITDPPVVLQQHDEAANSEAVQQQAVQQQAVQQPLSPPSQFVQPVQAIATNILPSDFVQLDNFLTAEEHQRLLKFVLRQESAFVSTSTSTGDSDYRKSVILHSFPEFANLVRQRIDRALPEVFAQLEMTAFPITQFESQLTGHNDGNYYKIHNDNGSPDTANREFTYVYYFYREPKAFSGGELLLYDSKIENNFYVQAETFRTVEPRNNSIVFFRSRYLHEVLPVRCPSRNFADSRFTINGWLRR